MDVDDIGNLKRKLVPVHRFSRKSQCGLANCSRVEIIISDGQTCAAHEYMYYDIMGCSYRLTLMRTNTSTGTKSSAPGTESSLAKLRRFMMVEHMRRMHWTLSRGVLYALMVLISD